MLIAEIENKGVKRRTKGEKTKHQILLATIKVLAKKGIKGTTHRAIAKEANIQLSLTTYYFKDIEELILQAILLNCEQSLQVTDPIWLKVFELISSRSKAELRKAAIKEELIETITELFTTNTIDRLNHKTDQLSVEQILFTQTHINTELLLLAERHKAILIEPFVKFSKLLGSKSSQIDAEILFAQIKHLEYDYLAYAVDMELSQKIENTIARFVSLIIKAK